MNRGRLPEWGGREFRHPPDPIGEPPPIARCRGRDTARLRRVWSFGAAGLDSPAPEAKINDRGLERRQNRRPKARTGSTQERGSGECSEHS